MTRIDFVCEFKSDIVLHSSSNTEGKVEKFDYIAGSNFLGMVAREYDSFGSDAFEVFHSGKVRFLDAHILVEDESTYQVPFAWFAPKDMSIKDAIENKKICNDHFVTKEEYKSLAKDDIQLKQQRRGFITHSGKVAKINHKYSQKSAYDRKNRRSKESAMFGYYALPKGTKWQLSVEMDDTKHKDRIIEILERSKRLGKSKSAEYGRVKIKHIDKKDSNIKQSLVPVDIDGKQYIFLYAYSRLALTDSYGVNSFKFDLNSLKLDNNYKIDWNKSQIRTSRYTPYNTKRENRDFERLIIDKGSIIAIEIDNNFDIEQYAQTISNGIGLYLSEGHGKVLVNPIFLTSKEPTFEPKITKENNEDNGSKTQSEVNKWLQTQHEEKEREFQLLKDVKEFIKNNNVKHKKSQWGQIRSLCSANSDSDALYNALFSEEKVNNHKKGFLLHGIAEKKWDKTLIEVLKAEKNKQKNYHSFVKLLSIYAPKEDDKTGVEDE